jgi:hypothetical protein
MPQLTDYLKAIDARNEQRVESLKALMDSMAQSQSQQSLQLQQLMSGSLTFRLEAPQQLQPPPSIVLSSTYTSAQASIAATPLACSPSPLLQGPSRHSQLAPQQEQEQEQRQGLELEPPKHRMCRAVRTVEALWREWTVGLQGNLSIEVLDRKWGNRWRAGRQSELQWYSLRLEVTREIRRVAQAQREEATMWQVSLQQQQTGCSLDQLCKRLRAGRRARSH